MTRDAFEYKNVINKIAGAMILFLLLFSFLHNYSYELYYLFKARFTPRGAVIFIGLLDAFAYLFSFIIPAAFLKIISRKKNDAALDLKATSFGRTLPLIIIAGVAVTVCFAFLNSVFLQMIGYSGRSIYPDYDYNSLEGFEYVIMFISIAIVPAFCEELLFRGVILKNLVPYGKVTAVIVSSLLFSLMHQNPAQFLYTFFSGVILALVCIETRSVWCGVFIHLFNNGISVFTQILQIQLAESAASYIISIMDGLICVGGTVSIIILVGIYDKKKKERQRELDEGFFERSFEQSYSYSPKKVSAREKILSFCSPLMLAFCMIAIINSF